MRVVIAIVAIWVVVRMAMGGMSVVIGAMRDSMGVRFGPKVVFNGQVRRHEKHLQRVGAQSYQQKQGALFLRLSKR
jgi:hypothetical protein